MRYWMYSEPVDEAAIDYDTIILSENQILGVYWEYWSNAMLNKGGISPLILEKNCIEDWIVVNWAIEWKYPQTV